MHLTEIEISLRILIIWGDTSKDIYRWYGEVPIRTNTDSKRIILDATMILYSFFFLKNPITDAFIFTHLN